MEPLTNLYSPERIREIQARCLANLAPRGTWDGVRLPATEFERHEALYRLAHSGAALRYPAALPLTTKG